MHQDFIIGQIEAMALEGKRITNDVRRLATKQMSRGVDVFAQPGVNVSQT